jgi:hypothetical protein
MKGLFRSRSEIGRLGSWDKESDVDDSVVSEDRPWLPESSDPDIGTGEYLSPKDNDSEKSSMPGAIKTRNKEKRESSIPFTSIRVLKIMPHSTSPQKPIEIKKRG